MCCLNVSFPGNSVVHESYILGRCIQQITLILLMLLCTGKLLYNKRFGGTKHVTIRSLYGRIRCIKIRVSGSDGIVGLQNRSLFRGFVAFRFAVTRWTVIRIAIHLWGDSTNVQATLHWIGTVLCTVILLPKVNTSFSGYLDPTNYCFIL